MEQTIDTRSSFVLSASPYNVVYCSAVIIFNLNKMLVLQSFNISEKIQKPSKSQTWVPSFEDEDTTVLSFCFHFSLILGFCLRYTPSSHPDSCVFASLEIRLSFRDPSCNVAMEVRSLSFFSS